MNPCDEASPKRSPFTIALTDTVLPKGKWCTVVVDWDSAADRLVLTVDGRVVTTRPFAWKPPFGLSYLHLQTLAEGLDGQGTIFRSFRAGQ